MPPAYQRTFINGVPVWKDTEGKIYYYESQILPENRICIGTDTGVSSNVKELLNESLQTYRQSIKPRTRAGKNE